MTEAAQGPALVMALAVGVLCAAGVRCCSSAASPGSCSG